MQTLETLLDAGAIRQLESAGARRGWHCLEVDAGGGSIALWLCERVAPDGYVLATDLDVTHVRGLAHPSSTCASTTCWPTTCRSAVRPDPHAARARLARGAGDRAAALKPGGRIVAEELDFAAAVPDPHMGEEACALFGRAVDAHHAALSGRFDVHYGRRVAGDFTDAGSLSEAELDRALALLEDPAFSSISPVVVAAGGIRPAAD